MSAVPPRPDLHSFSFVMSETKKSDFFSVPDNSTFKKLLLSKCLRRIDKFQQVGVEQFLHDVVNSIITNEFNSSKYLSFIDAAELDAIVESYSIFLKQTVNLALTKEQIAADLNQANVASGHLDTVLSVIKARSSEIKKSLTNEVSKIGKAILTDFDWKLHLSLSSDSISSYRQPLLLVNFTITSADTKKKEILLELTKNDLNALIATLEEANEEVKLLK
jgi:Ni,Fe-hydrogenase I large subunit